MSSKMLLSQKQIEFCQKGHRRWNFKGGATRSGKTYLDFKWIIPMRIRERVGKDGLAVILGVTKSTIERNVLEPMRNIYGTQLVGSISSDNTVWLFGERCYALGAEKVSQVSKIRGASIKYCYGDEVADWSEEVFALLKSRLDKEYSCFDGTFNPQHPGHWLKVFLDSDADIFSQTYTIDDNPFLPESFKENLKREYAGTVFYDRYILGRWVVAEGLVYPMFGESCIVPAVPRAYTEYIVSMDYGIQNPTAMLLWGKCEGIWYQIAEYYHSGRETNQQKTDQQYYDELEKLVGDLPVRKVIIDPSATSFIALLNQKKRFAPWRANNDVVDGIQHTASCLNDGTIKVNRCCGKTIMEYGLYRWDDKASERGEDRPIKENDHAMDATRYFVNTTGIWRKKKPYQPILYQMG